MSSAGNWAFNISGPYPCWVEVCFKGEVVARMHHNELCDLQYAVSKAIGETLGRLPREHWHEIATLSATTGGRQHG